MFFSINDVLQAWDSISENMFNSKLGNGANKKLKSGKELSLDYSYIIPTIIALGGDFQESKLSDFIQLTQGDPVVIWNIGGKSWSSTCRTAFSNQVIDCQYDLDERNLAVIYCPHGQPNTGILIACLLKYIGAFETTAQDILGDFSIICRFGGHLASTKDKSTLIFKYQNSTG
eukprot:gene29179-38245_t